MNIRKASFVVAFVAVLAFAVSASAQGQVFKVSVQAANIRLEPTTDSQVIGRAVIGEILTVVSQNRDWIKVVVDGKREGYILGRLGSMETIQAASTPAPVPAPAIKVRKEPAPVVVTAPPLSPAPVRTETTQTTQVAAKPSSKSNPGRFGVGLNLAAIPGGVTPGVLYDVSDRVTVSGAVGIYPGVTAVLGEVLYGFPRPPDPKSDYVFRPYVGGGLILVSVDYRFGSESFTGFMGSGGTFMTVKKIPHWRFSGDLSLVHFNVEGISVSGIGLRLGAHYMF